MSGKSRKFMVGLLAVMLLLVAAAAALVLLPASAQSLPLGLRSKLSANYDVGAPKGFLTAFRVSIIGETLRDLGMAADEAEGQAAAVEAALKDPVPTATARDFSGAPPFTATATQTATPTPTNTPTETSTPTATFTRTPKPTATPKPSKTPKPPKPTNTPCGACDTVKPTLIAGTLNPTPMAFTTCNAVVSITGLRVIDPGPSSGIEWVKLKYKVVGPGSKGYIYSPDLSPPVGDPWSGTTWDATYNGSITIDFDTGYASITGGGKVASRVMTSETATPTPSSPFTIELWAKAEDEDGNQNYIHLGDYTMPASCD